MTKRGLAAMQRIGQIVLLLALAGCALPSQVAAPGQLAPPSAAPAATLDARPAAADRLYVTGTDEYGVSRVFVLNSASGDVDRMLPSGYIAPDWSTLYQVAPGQSTTTIRAYDVATGRMLRETTINGLYDVPVLVDDPSQSAFSPDGRWLVLIQPSTDAELQAWEATGKIRSRMLVLDTSFRAPPRPIELDGNFSFDALSTGGTSLYLIQVLDPPRPPRYGPGQSPHYQVRRYDVATARLDEQPVVDKSETGPMTGGWHVSLGQRDGEWLYSLYTRDTEGPFVHVLNLNDRYSVCVDLPFPTNHGNFESDLMWSLALAPDQSTLYAINMVLGQVAAVNTQTFEVRSATLPRPKAQMPSLLAQLGKWLVPVAEGKRLLVKGAAVSPDGQMLYAVDGTGLVAVATRDLSLQGRFMGGWTLSSLAIRPTGDALYAASDDKGAIIRLALPAAGSSPVRIGTPVHARGIMRVSSDR